MQKLTASFDEMSWETTHPGIREKKIVTGARVIRLLKLTDELTHPDWCTKGHTGYVVEGSFILNINGEEIVLNQGDVFHVEEDDPAQRHIPVVESGGGVTLLLVEEN